MKIKVINSNTKQAVANAKIQLQIKGKNSGYQSLTTDASGILTLDDKFKDHQITSTLGGVQPQWITASEGATLIVTLNQKAPVTTGEKHSK